MSGETRVKAGGELGGEDHSSAALPGHLLAGESSPAPDTPRSSRFQPNLKRPDIPKFQLDLDTPRLSGSQRLTLQDSQYLHLAPNTQILRIPTQP